MRGKGDTGKMIADGALLKLNAKAPMEDARVPLLREKLGLAGDASDLKYDAKLAEAVKKFQRANELPVTGNVDAKTIKELNGPPRDKSIDMVVSNMERWRWYPRDLGNAHVVVNLPDFTLKVMHNGAQVWTTRIVIGKPRQGDPAAHRDDEVCDHQPDLERAAIDRLRRVSAGAAAGSDGAGAHGPEAGQ